jgi:hypothetical protein
MYRAVARGVANEVDTLVGFLNTRYADGSFNHVDASEVRRLAATSWCACRLERPGEIRNVQEHDGFMSGLAQLAVDAAPQGTRLRQVPPEHVPPGLWFGTEQAMVEGGTPWPRSRPSNNGAPVVSARCQDDCWNWSWCWKPSGWQLRHGGSEPDRLQNPRTSMKRTAKP